MRKTLSNNLREPWKFERPVCREIGGELFYAGDEDDPQQIDNNFMNTQMAKRICMSCEHIVECREWGLNHESFGVWGGLSPKELSTIRNQKRIPLRSLTTLKFM